MAKRTFLRSYLFYFVTLIIFVGGLLFWVSDLTSDPPLYFSGLGQSLSTDPAQYVHHARNKILFDDFDPFDYPRWKVYQQSLTSTVAYLWFSLAGVSQESANAVGMILSLLGLIFVLLAVRRHHRPWVTAAVALCYLINVCLLVYGRLSYLENGLILITSWLFFVYSMWGERTWGRMVCGALVAVAMLMGKLFGVLLLPALVLTIWFAAGEERAKQTALSIASFALTAVVLVVVLYGTDLSAVVGYFTEQSYGLRGFPEGLSSPWGFFEHLISYGFSSRLFFLNLDLVVFMMWSAYLLVFVFSAKGVFARMSPVTRLAAFVVPCLILGLMPLNYSPLRYALFLIPAIIVLCFTLQDQMMLRENKDRVKPGYFATILLGFVFWHGLSQILGTLFFVNDFPTRQMTWFTLPVAASFAYLVRLLIVRGKLTARRPVLISGLVVILLFSIGLNVVRINKRVLFSKTNDITAANEDLASILGPGAVISGPYAPALTIDNDMQSFIYLFGVANVDSTLFQRYPITHLAIDESNWVEAVNSYPALKGVMPSTTYWIRDYSVRICNISRLFGNPEALKYVETGYERAARYSAEKKYDSAFFEMRRFIVRNPNSRSANILFAELMLRARLYDETIPILTRLAGRYPNDYYVNIFCGRSMQAIGLLKNDPRLINTAQTFYEKAVRNNPFKSDFARRLWETTKQQFSAAAAGQASP